MNKYSVKPNGPGEAFEIEADSAEFDPQSGRTNFYKLPETGLRGQPVGEQTERELVASYLNVSFHKLPDEA